MFVLSLAPMRILRTFPVQILRRLGNRRRKLRRRRQERKAAWLEAEATLSAVEQYLAAGAWRLLTLFDRNAATSRLTRLKVKLYFACGLWRQLIVRELAAYEANGIDFMLVHESLDPVAFLHGVMRVEVDRYWIWLRPLRSLRPMSFLALGLDRIVATAIVPRHSGKVLCFDVEGQLAARIEPSELTAEYEFVRNTFSAKIPSVSYEVLPGRRAILESVAEGPNLYAVDVWTQVETVLRLLNVLPELTAVARRGDNGAELTRCIERTKPASLVRAHAIDIVGWLGSASFVPCHGDLLLTHVVMAAQGPLCIDFGGARWASAWYDGTTLTFSSIQWLSIHGSTEQIEMLTAGFKRFLLRTTALGSTKLPEDWRKLIALAYVAVTLTDEADSHLFQGPGAWAESIH